jgi:hypothetical protein
MMNKESDLKKSIQDILNKFGLFPEADAVKYQAASEKIFAKSPNWSKTEDMNFPYTATVDGKTWTVRINDFPEEELYTLLIDGKAVLSFSDEPGNWHFPELNPNSAQT